MLAIVTNSALALIETPSHKQCPPSAITSSAFAESPTAATWSIDNSLLFVAFANSISKYDCSGNWLQRVYSAPSIDTIQCIVSKDKGNTLIFNQGSKIHVLECGTSSPRITHTFESHKSPLTSLSLSYDASLLASTSSGTVHVHNLSLASHTVLRALPSDKLSTSTFHPHSRTRLLLGMGKQLVVYDTTRPSGPIKVIALPEATANGEIVGVACSPFSKTLCAVATNSGHIGLIDLDKEKSLFRTLSLKVPLTFLAFSPEGASIYASTENGKLLITDLRALDKPPKAMTVGEDGGRIIGVYVQKKVKNAPPESAPTTRSATATTAKATTSEPPRRAPATRKPAPSRASPTKPTTRSATTRAGKPSTPIKKSSLSPMAKPHTADKKVAAEKKKEEEKKKPFSPVRDPLGNSAAVGLQGTTNAIKESEGVFNKLKESKASLLDVPRRTRAGSSASQAGLAEDDAVMTRLRARASTISSSSNINTDRLSAAPATTVNEPAVHLSRQASITDRLSAKSTSSSQLSSTQPQPQVLSSRSSSSNGSLGKLSAASRMTPSPDLPAPDEGLISPLKRKGGKKGMSVLGLGTPEVDEWVKAGRGDEMLKGKGKRVGFMDDSDDSDVNRDNDDGDSDDGGDEGAKKDGERKSNITMAVQISPRRPTASTTSWTAVPSPLRNAIPSSSSSSPSRHSGATSNAHDLLRSIVSDILYDLHRDQKAQLTGMHLDMIRMGRGWRRELGDVLQELGELKLENGRLREENERLKRGY